MRIALIDDADVLKVLGNADPTYYVANKLRTAYPGLDTPSTLRKLKDMESRGLVKRVETHYFSITSSGAKTMKCNHLLSKVSEGKTETLKVCADCNKILKRIPKSTIQPKDVAVVFTGKAYARVLTDFETTQLQALDTNAREVEPFILRSVKNE